MATYHEMIRQLPGPDRFVRALALTAYTRHLAWQGAMLRTAALGPVATEDRFMTQLYGATVAGAFRAARESRATAEAARAGPDPARADPTPHE